MHNRLKIYQNKNLIRVLKRYGDRRNHAVKFEKAWCFNFSSNDYLSLAMDDRIKQACIDGINRYGFGAASSPSISGYSVLHQALEEQFADFLRCEKALLFNSGYLANLGVLSALSSRKTVFVADKYCHASLIDGLKLSQAKYYRYKHLDMTHLQQLISEKKPDYIVTESVFSVGGEIAPVRLIEELRQQFQSMLIVDDAHGIGVLGKNGAGVSDLIQAKQSACIIVPLGKAFAGMGAIVAGSAKVINTILQFARTHRYTTALPPAVCMGLLKSLEIIRQETFRRDYLQELIEYFINQVKQKGIELNHSDSTPIKSIVIGGNLAVLELQKQLQQKGFLVACMRPPSVPAGKACVRISINYSHTKSLITQLLDVIAYATQM